MWHCGAYQAAVFSHGSLSPCFSFPGLACALLVAAFSVAFVHFAAASRQAAGRADTTRDYLHDYVHGVKASAPLTLALLLQVALLVLSLKEDWGTDFLIAADSVQLVALAVLLAVSFHGVFLRIRSPAAHVARLFAAVYLYRSYVLLVAGITGWTHRPRWYPYTAAGLCFGVALLVTVFSFVYNRAWRALPASGALQEPLLNGGEAEKGGNTNTKGDTEGKKKRTKPWYELTGRAMQYVWPKELSHKLRVLLCVSILLAVRVLNLGLPIINKHMIDTLSQVTSGMHPGPGQPQTQYTFREVFLPWVMAYLGLALLQGGFGTGGTGGLLSNARSYFWIPVSQQAYSRVTLDVFVHALDLDLNYHLHRKTGEVLTITSRGSNAMQQMLSMIVFSIGPQIFDILAGSIYLATFMQPWVAVIVFVTCSGYIPMTIALTEWRGSFRRDMNAAENARSAIAADALLNYETVKYFNAEDVEAKNYAEAIKNYQVVEYKLMASLNMLNILQSVVIWVGAASGLTICVKGVVDGHQTVGDVALFLSLISQLFAPLNYFGTYVRMMQQTLIDMENLFQLLDKNTQIQDAPDAKPLVLNKRDVEFDHVCFSYVDTTAILKQVTFTAPGGKTMALVGATGSGKSTCLRLIYRFYDVTSGSIRVDGQDVKHVTLSSLRRAIGMVPQDVVLFNNTCEYNIGYGRPGAASADVFDAARAAAIHDTILEKFPQGYNTVVGERGLRLSGGEKQRVAVARAVLKDAPILLLDEATSALDSITERQIQEAIKKLRSTRTTIIVAHRLSTVMDADVIVVFKDGSVAEQGSHAQLVAAQGLFASMWQRQKESPDFDEEPAASSST